MPVETTCNDLQKRHVKVVPNGDLDAPPTWAKTSGNGSIVPDGDGMGAYLVSEDNVVGNGPFDTVYEVKAMAGGAELMDTVTLHVSNDVQTQPATNLGLVFDLPELK